MLTGSRTRTALAIARAARILLNNPLEVLVLAPVLPLARDLKVLNLPIARATALLLALV
jgi:hypothetical protein